MDELLTIFAAMLLPLGMFLLGMFALVLLAVMAVLYAVAFVCATVRRLRE